MPFLVFSVLCAPELWCRWKPESCRQADLEAEERAVRDVVDNAVSLCSQIKWTGVTAGWAAT